MVKLAVAVTLAWPLVWMVAVESERFADAPPALALAAKLTTPPATGSMGLLAVTVTASGLVKVAPAVADWGVLPATGVMVKPWLWKAPISGWEARGSPRWSVVMPLTAVPAPMAALPGRRAMVRVGPP